MTTPQAAGGALVERLRNEPTLMDGKHAWPAILRIRDTLLHDDMGGGGQRIYTTAGRGYEKREYVRADILTQHEADRGSVVKALRDFACWAIRAGAFQGADLDGLSIQEKAQELGLIDATTYDPEKHGPCGCAEAGMDWLVFSPALSVLASEGAAAMPVAGSPVSQSVAVKALEWRKSNVVDRWTADTKLANYEIVYDQKSEQFGLFIRGVWSWFGCLSDAQDVGQAEFNALVRSALTADAGSPVSEAPGVVEPVAWRYEHQFGVNERWHTYYQERRPEEPSLYRNVTPLYTHPAQPTPPASEAVPVGYTSAGILDEMRKPRETFWIGNMSSKILPGDGPMDAFDIPLFTALSQSAPGSDKENGNA